ncbi:hypothetical protein F5878DRAFT_548642, partial [Lentinula raphanica]
IFFFGAIQEGLRGPQFTAATQHEEAIGDITTYGIDWDDLANPTLLRHHNQHNPDEIENLDYQPTRLPSHLSLIEIPAFECPFTSEAQLKTFNEALLVMPEYHSRDMGERKTLWMQALDLLQILLS